MGGKGGNSNQGWQYKPKGAKGGTHILNIPHFMRYNKYEKAKLGSELKKKVKYILLTYT